MKTQSRARRFRAGSLVAALVVSSAGLVVRPAMAHEAPCPYCNMTITQDTAEQDNETVLKIGRKRVEYKCVYCALAEAKTEYKGDVTILAPSEKKGEPVTLKRTGGKWTATPETVYFVSNAPLKHKVCNVQARAFTTQAAAQAYIAKNKEQLPNAKPLTLTEMLAVVDAGNK
jgi:Alkylmercury lyase